MEDTQKSDHEIKLKCLKIAIAAASSIRTTALSYSADQLIEDAQKIEKYVLGSEK